MWVIYCCTKATVPQFYDSHRLLVWSVAFSVASWTFHSDGGKSGDRLRSTSPGMAEFVRETKCMV